MASKIFDAQKEIDQLAGAEKFYFEYELNRLNGQKWQSVVTKEDLVLHALGAVKRARRFSQSIIPLMEGFAKQELEKVLTTHTN